jgi:hypothetical protein
MVAMDIRTYEEQLETMAFLKLINLGKKGIAEGNVRVRMQGLHDHAD